MSGNAEAAGNMAAKASAYAASGGLTLLGGMTAQEWAAIVGIVLAFATFAVNWHYQRKRHKLAIDSFELKREYLQPDKPDEEDHRCT